MATRKKFEASFESLENISVRIGLGMRNLGYGAIGGLKVYPWQGIGMLGRCIFKEVLSTTIMGHYGHPSKFGYKDICALWKQKFNPEDLMSLYKSRCQVFCCSSHAS